MTKKLTALVIMDGFGLSDSEVGNAVKAANTPHIDALIEKYPHTVLLASGRAVGLPEGQMGNSEVGHLNMGAGRIVYQDLTRVTKAIEDGDFFENDALIAAIDNALEKNTAIHFMGLCSDGGVHSHLNHLYALVEMCKRRGLDRVYIHCFTDGRDVPPTSGIGYIQQLQEKLAEIGVGEIATIEGRYYAMDRDNRWERVEEAYNAMVLGEGHTYGTDAVQLVQQSYDEGLTDEFIKPIVLQKDGKPVATMQENDSVVFYNFRPDRARELTRALLFEDFNGFERKKGFFPLCYVSMTQYDELFEEQLLIAFGPEEIKNTLGEYLATQNKAQLHIAETEKYAHVTFFFNGGEEAPFEKEQRVLIPSPKVATYDLQPEMSAHLVTEKALKLIESDTFDFMVLNFANPDMVGHTGVFDAAVQAVEVVDECVGKVAEAILKTGGSMLLTADHGNSEWMLDDNGNPATAHTTNPVPLVLVSEENKNATLKEGGKLSDLAPTILELMGLEAPSEMTGKSLIQ